MGLGRKVAQITGIAACLGLAGIEVYKGIKYDFLPKRAISKRILDLREYAAREVPIIMKEHEARFKISYGEGTPQIRVSEIIDQGFFAGDTNVRGCYFLSEDTIWLSSYWNRTPHGSFEREGLQGSTPARRTIAHELGHYYMDRRSEMQGKGDWPQFEYGMCVGIEMFSRFQKEEQKAKTKGDTTRAKRYKELGLDYVSRNRKALVKELATRALSEGVAVYFQYNGNKPPQHQNIVWPNTFEEINPRRYDYYVYDGGFTIIQPILDIHGVERGVDYIITHPPTAKTVGEIPAYTQRALNALARRK